MSDPACCDECFALRSEGASEPCPFCSLNYHTDDGEGAFVSCLEMHTEECSETARWKSEKLASWKAGATSWRKP